MSEKYNIACYDAKYVIEEAEKNMLNLCRDYPDFYKIHVMSQDFTEKIN